MAIARAGRNVVGEREGTSGWLNSAPDLSAPRARRKVIGIGRWEGIAEASADRFVIERERGRSGTILTALTRAFESTLREADGSFPRNFVEVATVKGDGSLLLDTPIDATIVIEGFDRFGVSAWLDRLREHRVQIRDARPDEPPSG